MRILSEATLIEMLQKYMVSTEPGLRGNIVFRNAERRRQFCRELTRNVVSDEFNLVRHGNVISFRNHNLIKLSIIAQRPTMVFDDILVDESIDDVEVLMHLDGHEYYNEDSDYAVTSTIYFENGNIIRALQGKPADLGEFETSPEILEYIGGAANGSDICRNP